MKALLPAFVPSFVGTVTALALSLGLCGASVVACSSSSSATPTPAVDAGPVVGTTDEFSQAAAARAKAYCDRLFDCCDAASQTLLMSLYANGADSRDKCEAGISDWMKPNLTTTTIALTRKDVEFYPSREADCVKADAAESCSDFFTLGGASEPKMACDAAFGGKIAEGGGCSFNQACLTGYCKLGADLQSGVCAPLPKEGDACESATECGGVADLYCDRTDDSKTCKFVEGVCRVRDSRADNSPCCNAEECSGKACINTNKGHLCSKDTTVQCSK